VTDVSLLDPPRKLPRKPPGRTIAAPAKQQPGPNVLAFVVDVIEERDFDQNKSASYLDFALRTDPVLRASVAWFLVSDTMRKRSVRAQQRAKYGERAAI
jgi:hypothetical protein